MICLEFFKVKGGLMIFFGEHNVLVALIWLEIVSQQFSADYKTISVRNHSKLRAVMYVQ
jgi:hypothetical protein